MKINWQKIIYYAMTKPRAVDEAYFKFFGHLPVEQLPTEWEELFLEWLVYDYKQASGATFLAEYILRNPDRLDNDSLDRLRQISLSQIYSMFEILEINRGNWFILEDLQTGKVYRVYEKTGTSTIDRPGTIPGRIALVNNRWYLVGANSVYYPITHTPRAKKIMRKMKTNNYSPKDTVELLKAHEQKNPQPPAVNKKQIEKKKLELRQDYEKKSGKYQLALSFDDLIGEIYQENRVNIIDFWRSLTKKGLTEEFLFKELQLLQDIWNYFPHKYVGGLSPVEAFNKMKADEEKDSRRP